MPDILIRDRRVFPLGVLLTLTVQGALAPPVASSWPTFHFPTAAGFNHTLAAGDLNGDGWLDVATPNSTASVVSVLLGNGDGTLAAFLAYAVFGEPQDVQMADLTGDGVPDLAVASYGAAAISMVTACRRSSSRPAIPTATACSPSTAG